MIVSSDYQLVEIVDEYLLVPVGRRAEQCKDVFSLSRAGAFLYCLLNDNKTKEDLVISLVDKYDIDKTTAIADIEQFLGMLCENGLIEVD